MRLSTRLALSYLGFLVLLILLVLLLAGFQVTRLVRHMDALPFPASAADAGRVADHLAANGLTSPIPAAYLDPTLAVGGWAQVLDLDGREVSAVAAPANRMTAYRSVELATANQPWRDQDWYFETTPIRRDAEPLGLVILAIPRGIDTPLFSMRLSPVFVGAFWQYFLTGVGLSVLTAILVALLIGLWYARKLARPLVRLSAELETAAAGDFTHRIPELGGPEFAVLARAYNHLVERLDESQREQARLEQARRDLVANISHDLRTPLTSIQGFTEAMADPSAPPEVRARHANTVANRIGELNAMLGDLLELSRLQALPDLQRTPVDLAELAREQVIGLMPQIEAAGLELEADLPDGLPAAPVEPRLIARALQNLLSNAIRHSQGARQITVALYPSGTGLALEVADDGPGIPAADLPQLFERFYQGTSSTNRRQGNGLGLAIVKQIAENHGGSIAVKSSPHGTVFTLWLPLSG